MSVQDKTEQVLRDFHILFSRCEAYGGDANKVIVDKSKVIGLLNRLNACIYEMMEEYGQTQGSREAGEREARRRRDEIVLDANHKAEEVYAASVLYTDEALSRAREIMREAAESMKAACDKLDADMQKEMDIVRRDQSELKSHLMNLKDTEKYLKLIEERNKEISKEKAQGEEAKEPEFKPIKPEIKINRAYFERMGIPIEDNPRERKASYEDAKRYADEEPHKKEKPHEEAIRADAGPGQEPDPKEPVNPSDATSTREEVNVRENEDFTDGQDVSDEDDTDLYIFEDLQEDEKPAPIVPEIKVNLDAEYFKWKAEAGQDNAMEKKAEKEKEKHSVWGRILK